MELGTCFVREDILLKDRNELENSVKFQSKISYRRRGTFYKEASRCRAYTGKRRAFRF